LARLAQWALAMPSPAHETLVTLLRDSPPMLNLLLDAMGLAPLPTTLQPDDPTQRVANPVEVRPDLLLVEEGLRGAWVLVEVQLGVDPDKQRTWLAATAVLYDARRTMGDLLVITHDASVAAWARTIAHATGPGGTALSLRPTVLLLTRNAVGRLLATGRPELAVMAAWAVHDQKGRLAKKVVREAAVQIDGTTDLALRATLRCAMLSMLDNDLLNTFREMIMLSPDKFPLDPEREELSRQMEAFFEPMRQACAQAKTEGKAEGKTEGKTEGKAEAVLAVLQARGLVVDAASRTRILGCDDLTQLDRWIVRAVTVSATAALFTDEA